MSKLEANVKLVNMKIDPKAEQEKYAAKESTLVDAPRYPYGLCLHLEDDTLKKLGLLRLPEVGKPMMLTALVDVTSVSENEYTTEGGKTEKRQSCSLQITDLALTSAGDISAAQKLYKE